MTALHRKLWRDLSQLRGQVLTIALVVGCGIASYVTLQSAHASLVWARDVYYEAQRFADIFAHLTRAPETLRAELDAAPGVAVVETRIVANVMLPLTRDREPALGRIISLPASGTPRLNAIFLRRGRMFEPGRNDEVVVLESFAQAHGLELGSLLEVVVEGKSRAFRIVGTALSPEYVFSIGGAQLLQDDRRFAVLWMDRAAIAPALRMEGAFNDVLAKLQPNASERSAIDAFDRILSRYGGLGAVARSRQVSHWALSSELDQLAAMSSTIPLISLAVAAFLLNVVLARLVHLQRPQIAALKALGYKNFEVATHYLTYVSLIALAGTCLGIAAGAWLGRGMISLYAPYFRFPSFPYRLEGKLLGVSFLISLGAGLIGCFGTLRGIVRLPPAEAMRPDAPARFRRSWLELFGVGRLFGTAERMAMRELGRKPLRTFFSVLGLSLSIAVVVSGRFIFDAIDVLLELGFERSQLEDMAVSFRNSVSERALGELRALPGVLEVEPERSVPVRLRAGSRARELAIVGRHSDASLRRILEWPVRVVRLPEDGLLLTDVLAERLKVKTGDEVQVEVLEGDRRVRSVRVAGTASDVLGLNAYMNLSALQRVLGEQEGMTQALLRVDPQQEADLLLRLNRMPNVIGIARRQTILDQFQKQTAETLWITTSILTLFGAVIAVGIVYNNARIALSLRGRDLATLRVLGFSRVEVWRMFLTERMLELLLAGVPGLWLGVTLVQLVYSAESTQEQIRMPQVTSLETFLYALVVALAAFAFSAALMRQKLNALDMLAVLKSSE